MRRGGSECLAPEASPPGQTLAAHLRARNSICTPSFSSQAAPSTRSHLGRHRASNPSRIQGINDMSKTVSDFFWERMSEWGIRRIFGYPGDGINGLLGALDRADDRFDFVQARHEELAAFMACAHAKFTGELGVCLATSGPGAIHLLNGLYDARLDHQPVLAIVGQQAQHRARRPLSAGSRSDLAVQGCGRRIRAHGDLAGAGPAPDRPRRAHRQGRAHRDLHHPAERPAGNGGDGQTTARPRHRALRRRLQCAEGDADR